MKLYKFQEIGIARCVKLAKCNLSGKRDILLSFRPIFRNIREEIQQNAV